MTDPLPEITRIGGGGSARIGLMILGVALVVVVGIGIVGRQPPAPVAVLPPGASPEVSSTPAGPRPTPTPSPTPAPPETYGASLSMGNVRYVTIMSELSPGHLSAELHFPSPPMRPVGTLEFSELWENGEVDRAIVIGSWNIDLEALANATSSPTNVLESTEPAEADAFDQPPPVRSGYWITAYGANDLLFSRLTIEVELAQHLDYPGAAPTRRFGVEATVGDLHRSVILEPDDQGSFTGSLTLPAPHRATTAHLLLQDVQMTVSHDVWSELADFAFELTPDQSKDGVSEVIVAESGPTFRILARTLGHGSGQSIDVTVIARRLSNSDLSR